jgi:hypothetical protein
MQEDLRIFIDRAIVPALLDRFLREQGMLRTPTIPPMRPAA